MKLEKHQIITKFCEGLNKGLANSFLLIGDTGTGKTEQVLKTIEQLKLKEGVHYRYFSNYSTPLELFNILKDINELEKPRLLIIDDCELLLSDQKSLSLFRSALWGYPERFVYWYSTSPKVPTQRFRFDGKLIFLVNKLNLKNPLIQALVSRGFYYHLELSNQEKLSLMRERLKEPYHNLSLKEREKIIKYIEEIGRYSDKLNLRSLPMAYSTYILSPNHWKELTSKLLT